MSLDCLFLDFIRMDRHESPWDYRHSFFYILHYSDNGKMEIS